MPRIDTSRNNVPLPGPGPETVGRARLVVRILISLLVSGLFIFISLRKADLGAVLMPWPTPNPVPVLGYLAILLVVHVVKTMRWGLLLRPLGEITFRRLNAASAVGLHADGDPAPAPGRAGPAPDRVRPMPGSDERCAHGCLASMAVERIIDSLAVGVLAIVSCACWRPLARPPTWLGMPPPW